MWMDIWLHHRGKLLGTAFGFLLGFLYLLVGLWDMLIFAFIVYIGYYMGKKLDQGERLLHIEILWKWLTDRWKMFR